MTNAEGNPNDELRNGSGCLAQGVVIRGSSLTLPFHVSNRRESRDRLADPCQLGRRDYLINIFVSATCFLGEACPRGTANVNAARFEIALELLAVPLFARLGATHGAAAPVRCAKEGFGA